MKHELPFTQEDFKDGITALEKYNLACDLFMCSNSLQAHDQSVFQLIAGLNTVKEILIEANLITAEDFHAKIARNLELIYKIFEEKMSEAEKKNQAA